MKVLEKVTVTTEEGRALERRKRIVITTVTSTILKGLLIGTPLITLNITYNYLNSEIYGLWSAATTFFSLFAFSDLGLGNGLQTKLSNAYGKGDIDLSRKIISNTYIILIVFSIIFLTAFLISFPYINWASVMNAQSSQTILLVSSVVLAIVIPKLLSIPTAIIQRTQLALQEGYKSDIWNIIGCILNVICIYYIAKWNLGKITLLITISLLPVVISVLNVLVYFFRQRPELKISIKLFDFNTSKQLLSLGILFCVLSMLTTIGLSMDTFIVARTCSLVEAGSYSILYKVATIFSAVVSILSAPLWGANGEAIAKGDIMWVKKNTRKTSLIMGGIAIFLSLVVLIFSKYIFRLWIGKEFAFSLDSLVWLSIMQIFISFISPYFMVLNAFGIVKKQIIIFSIYTPICFLLKYYLSKIYGISAIPAVGAILYICIIVTSIFYLSNKYLNRQLKTNAL